MGWSFEYVPPLSVAVCVRVVVTVMAPTRTRWVRVYGCGRGCGPWVRVAVSVLRIIAPVLR